MTRGTESEQIAWLVTAVKWTISVASSMWLSMAVDVKILCVLASVDIVTCLFNSEKSLLLLCRRLAITFILVGAVHFVYSLAREQTGLNVGFDIGAMVCTFYSLGETIAILRNVDAAGVRIPPVLLEWVSKAEGITGSDKEEIVALQIKQGAEHVALDLKIAPKKDQQS